MLLRMAPYRGYKQNLVIWGWISIYINVRPFRVYDGATDGKRRDMTKHPHSWLIRVLNAFI